jgi:hypothetical protein
VSSRSSASSLESPEPVSPVLFNLGSRNNSSEDIDPAESYSNIDTNNDACYLPLGLSLYEQSSTTVSSLFVADQFVSCDPLVPLSSAPWMCVYDLDAAYDGSSNDDDDNNKSLLDSRSENTAAPPVWPPQDQHLLSSPPFQHRSTPLQPNTTFPLNFLPKDLQQIYRRGLIPCVTEWFQAEEEHGLLDPAYRWRGLLPLGPAVQFPTIKGSVPLRQRRQSKSTNRQLSRQRGQTRIRPRPSPFRQTIHAFSPQQDSECEYALVCLMKILLLMTTNDLLRILFLLRVLLCRSRFRYVLYLLTYPMSHNHFFFWLSG